MAVRLHPHAVVRASERGVTEAEVLATVEGGEQFPAKYGRVGFRRNFVYDGMWRGQSYQTKQVEAYAVEEDGWLVIHRHRPLFLTGVAMQLTYDPRHNIAYIRLRESGAEVETLHISESLNVDIGPDGTVYGIELLNANEQLPGKDGKVLVVVNEAKQERQTVPLAL